jgi:hypothetical protein
MVALPFPTAVITPFLHMSKSSNKAKLKIGLPSTLRIVKSLKDKPAQNAVGGVTVTYSSDNKKVAKVDHVLLFHISALYRSM